MSYNPYICYPNHLLIGYYSPLNLENIDDYLGYFYLTIMPINRVTRFARAGSCSNGKCSAGIENWQE